MSVKAKESIEKPTTTFQTNNRYTRGSKMSEDRKASEGLEDEAPAPEIDFPEGSGLISDEKFEMYDPYSL